LTSAVPPTRFRDLSPVVALAVLVATVVLVLLLVPVALHYQEPLPAHAGDGDLALYGRIVVRLHAGDSFYPAAHAELIAGHYGTLSVLNWRTPLYPTILGLFPSIEIAQMALGALALAAGTAACALVRRQANLPLEVATAVALVISLGACLVPKTVLYSEFASGVLLLLSASAFGLGHRRTGFAAAVVALFFRELAAPYILICLVLAWREKRVGEAVAWLLALVAYAGFYFWHYQMVQAELGPADFAYPGGWLRFGGATFVLSTAGFNGLLIAMPLWISAIVLPLAALGLLAWPGRADVRIALTVFAYLAAFAVVGKPLNRYWGAMYTPLLTLGLPWAALAAIDLARAATAHIGSKPAG
jgi:hypothetical protein